MIVSMPMTLSRRELGGILAGLGVRTALGAGSTGQTGMDQVLRDGIARRKIPAVVGMVANGNQVLYSGAFGTRDSSGVAVTPNSIFSIASMTKAITTVAALQMVEPGKLTLDEPVSKYLPELANLQVLDGVRLRPAKVPVTLRHLLTHTSGFCYSIWDADMNRYDKSLKGKAPRVTPLMFEPGTRWQYGTGVDWAGRIVEAVSGMTLEDYFQANILKPLEMTDTSYILPEEKFDRLVNDYQKLPDGSFRESARKMPKPPGQYAGGGGLYSTTGDYTKFMQMILGKGQGVNKARILSEKTVAAMEVNQIGNLTAGKMKSFDAVTSADVDIQPGFTEKWGLGFLINTTAYPGGRSAGSLAWAGILNTFYWIDPKRSLCGVLMMQYLPFVDPAAISLLGEFERAAYKL
jgi:methyl acetate hydrolase